jgi:hypothetical protein
VKCQSSRSDSFNAHARADRQLRLEKVEGLSHDLLDVNRHAHPRTAAAEGEDALHQRSAPFTGGDHPVEIVPPSGSLVGITQCPLAVAEDCTEDVVEVVRDAACQRPHGFELLRLPQPPLESQVFVLLPLALGDFLFQPCIEARTVFAAGVNGRIAARISSGGWGDGATKFRQQHAAPEAWRRFEELLAAGRAAAKRGESLRISSFDIVPIPPKMRGNLPAGSYMEFPFEVVESMYGFRPNTVVANIAPRPLLILHPAVDSVTPTEQSIEIFRNARMPADLHLFSDIDHFIFLGQQPAGPQRGP